MTPNLHRPTSRLAAALRRLARQVCAVAGSALLAAAALAPVPAQAVDLADKPLFSTISVPGNLALALSVEWPTATTPAYPSTVAYTSASTYLGYFDAAKCYRYVAVNTGTTAAPDYSTSYFTPDSLATNRTCASTSTTALWSGNYLNWASMQTLDAFRWVLTGGYRSVDTATNTILTKTYAAQDSGVMPHKTTAAGVNAATPFNYGSVITKLRALGIQMWITAGGPIDCSFSTTTGGNNTFSCTTSQGTRSCNTAGTATCTVAVTDGTNLSCSRTGNGPYTYRCNAIDASATTGSLCSVANVAKVANANTTASCVTAAANVTDYTGQSTAAGTASSARIYRVYINVKVCDGTVGLESNCIAYSQSSKPEGLMQQYASKLRYSAFGYYNDGSTRDGGVMRARMKYIGPTKPVPGSTALSNGAAEWNAATGVMVTNPDTDDATATQSLATAAGWNVAIANSGVMNYLNKFGYSARSYKSKDPVSEMYSAVVRYFKNLGNVSEYTTLAGAGSSATAATWLDGFPSITSWDDPILYACQKNFILGIGDVNTWNDANLQGSALKAGAYDEPALPATVSADTSVNVSTATNMVGKLEGYNGSLGSIFAAPNSTTCGGSGQQCNSYYVAGLAYDSHTRDIRSDKPGSQTINTYWMDVLENQVYRHKNQYWLAAKYGGFEVPTGFDPYSSSNGTSTLPLTSWYNNTDTLTIGTNSLTYSTDVAGAADKRPDNYFPGNLPDRMKTGLTNAFTKIVSEVEGAAGTALATISPNITGSGSISYSTYYDPKNWSGRLYASQITYDPNGVPTATAVWNARDLLELPAVTAANRKIITCCTAAGAGLEFTNAALSSTTLNARTNYASFSAVPGVTSQSASNFIDYLRGDRSKELASGGVYRTRGYRLGDIVNSKPLAVGKPDEQYYDIYNAGYSQFKRTYQSRTPVVYIGANDGMLHAFDGTVGQTNSGKELFAYVPSFVYGSDATAATSGLASLGNPSFTHHYMVDGALTHIDVDLAKTYNSGQTGTNWRTLLVGGLGKGGKGYFALDITDASNFATTTQASLAGKVMWEFTHAHMGYSYSAPSIVKTKKYGWVAIIPSGYDNDDGKGYFFFVNVRTGALLEAVATPTGSVAAPINLGNLSAYVEDYTDHTADAVYGSDLAGNIWRVDLTGEDPGIGYPSPVKIATLTDASGNAQPLTTRPLIEVDPDTKKRYVIVGTGRMLGDSDIASNRVQSIYVIRDGNKPSGQFWTSTSLPSGYSYPIIRANLDNNSDLLSGVGASPTSPMGWYHDLPVTNSIAERIDVQPRSNRTVAVFGANTPNGEACSPAGTGQIYAIDFTTGQSVLVDNGNSPIASSGSLGGVITELAIQRVGGKLRVYAGTSTGAVANVRARLSGAGSFRLLNWRELPTTE